MAKILMKGNEAIAEAALRAGATNYFCYPITPQTEVAEYLAKRMPDYGGVFLQAESEVAVGNMLFGAASTGKRVFTSSSSPGISLMQEALSYMAGAHLPCVIINIMRGGPGLGGILPAQSDYFQATKGGGHGDYRILVLAPSNLQEAVDLTMLAFHLADKYRNPAMIIGDGMIGQMMEPVEFPEKYVEEELPVKTWAATGASGRKPLIIKSLFLDPNALEHNNILLKEKYDQMAKEEVRFELYKTGPKNRILLVSYGTMARICQTAIDALEAEGISVGLFRPISVYPFPHSQLREEISRPNVESVLTIEMSMGQMLEDVERAVAERKPLAFFGRTGGIVPSPEEVIEQIRKLLDAQPAPRKAKKA
ncbi:3-methyl-2-oxobutanoate dehydrogenase subunit beta [candidate division GN15 bacterium]|uniref:3-methyl-2-oxobutanoate dehydrogenase subunit beta n=1 Tax=candidate division GN15 bacterium TaxID=2072418 RepID=A0A855X0L5_9BACT|nr:MAG: 3-methyl-2-oxobutanoate dehydrogenase subunit beta [candidate division GN15 bacterium]